VSISASAAGREADRCRPGLDEGRPFGPQRGRPSLCRSCVYGRRGEADL